MTTNPFPTIPTCEISAHRSRTRPELQRGLGAAIGAAVGDALGARFEFGAAGQFSATFPEPLHGTETEMTGGGGFGWAPGEFTDDTQMAVLLGRSLAECQGYDPDDVWARWRRWALTASDVGISTRHALGHHDWRTVAHHDPERSAGNGALMRSGFLALALLDHDDDSVRDVVLHQSALSHHHPDAGWGAWIAVVAIQSAVRGDDPFMRIERAVAELPDASRDRFAPILAASWDPSHGATSNGSVWGCLAQAVWAVRNHDTVERSLIAAIDLGGDTDTVATVAGGLAGAIHGIQAVPARWTARLHGRVPGIDGTIETIDLDGLSRLARVLLGKSPGGMTPNERPAGPGEVAPGVHAANLLGAASSPEDWAVVSLCQTGGLFDGRGSRRQIYMIDDPGDVNLTLLPAVRDAVDAVDAFLAEGKQVVVHCHGGHSRTGLVLRAWYMRSTGCSEPEAHRWIEAAWPEYRIWQQDFTDFLRTEWTEFVAGGR
jgi:ADP-ribosyl-[dinitrogen reductase] hydrolase